MIKWGTKSWDTQSKSETLSSSSLLLAAVKSVNCQTNDGHTRNTIYKRQYSVRSVGHCYIRRELEPTHTHTDIHTGNWHYPIVLSNLVNLYFMKVWRGRGGWHLFGHVTHPHTSYQTLIGHVSCVEITATILYLCWKLGPLTKNQNMIITNMIITSMIITSIIITNMIISRRMSFDMMITEIVNWGEVSFTLRTYETLFFLLGWTTG